MRPWQKKKPKYILQVFYSEDLKKICHYILKLGVKHCNDEFHLYCNIDILA